MLVMQGAEPEGTFPRGLGSSPLPTIEAHTRLRELLFEADRSREGEPFLGITCVSCQWVRIVGRKVLYEP